MRIATDSFRGEVPRFSPRALPANAAQAAVNAKLVSGDLEAWRQFLSIKALTASAAVQTIYLLNDRWLSWTQQVDVARGIIPGDNTFRTYITGPGVYTTPRFTNYALATTGSEPFPVATRPLGVPAPDEPPAVVVNVAAVDESNVDVANPGGETGTAGWTVDVGSFTAYEDGDIAGLDAHDGEHFFGGGTAAASEVYQDIDIDSFGAIAGRSLKLVWFQATGAAGSTATMKVEFYDSLDVLLGTAELELYAPATALTWERREMTTAIPDGATTARLVQAYELEGAGPVIDAYIDSISLNVVEYSNFFDGSSLSGWEVSASVNPGGAGSSRSVEVSGAQGWAPPAWRFFGRLIFPWMHRDFAIAEAQGMSFKFDMVQSGENNGGMTLMLFADDAGRGSGVSIGAGGILLKSFSTWGDPLGTTVQALGDPISLETECTVDVRAEQASSGTARVTISIASRVGAELLESTTFNVSIQGSRIGLKPFVNDSGEGESFGAGPGGTWYVDNIYITVAAQSSRDEVISTATSYVYRFKNDLGEYGAPSRASDTVIRPDGGSVVVTMPTAPPDGTDPLYGITTKEIFRAVTGASGTAFFLVDEVPIAQAKYVDTKDDSAIADGTVLDSEDWDLPPSDLEGIIALPNGMMAGFRRNQLCLSVSGFPHAWRVIDRKTTDTDIVAIANIDNTIVIGTKSRVYTATGNTNDSYSMSAPGAPQACLSKRGMVFLDGVGVVFPSPDGWAACAGSAGNVPIITETVFTKAQWEALGPSTIKAAVHDGTLFWWSTGQTPDSGYALDVRDSGAGLVSLSFHATAVFVDPLSDSLYLVLDQLNEPTDALLPVATSAPALASPAKVIFKFDGATNGDLLRFRWRGKLHLPPYPATMTIAEIKAPAYTNLVVRIYGDGTLLMAKAVGSKREFTIPALRTSDSYEIELIGTSTVRTAQLAEDVMELA